METIKDIWYAVIDGDLIISAHKERGDAEHDVLEYDDAKVERVQIEITRIKTS